MKYENIYEGIFKKRLNRFVCTVEIDGKTYEAHLKNTGRLKELLFEGNCVYLEKTENPNRKTLFDVVFAQKKIGENNVIINIDSQSANDTAYEWLGRCGHFSENAKISREVTYGSSRFDFYIEDGSRKIFLEVKGCTLEKDFVAYFPDAPTERGVKHINELINSVYDGYEAYILFIVQMKGVKELRPNELTHKAFADALRTAQKSGVKIIAVDCITEKDTIFADKEIPVIL
ncbi:MAG: DNA/RNA nuclease SfsA [Ruminococcaceae bacterium]|nr:DNA/RNA nuclease SfsA [Oscillospiraceae bacterium]